MSDSNGYHRVERTGDWSCDCGQEYRVLAREGELSMWPKNSENGFCLEQAAEKCFCGAALTRGTVLSALFGANPRKRRTHEIERLSARPVEKRSAAASSGLSRLGMAHEH